MKNIVLISAFICSYCCSFAQNFLIEKGQNASYIQGFIGNDRDAFQKGISIGFSINGRLDMMLSGSHASAKSSISASYAISPSLNFLVIKQDKFPFSLGVSTEYEIKRFPQTDLLKHNSVKAGISIFHKFRVNEKLSSTPGTYAKASFVSRSLDIYKDHAKTYTFGIQNTLLFKQISITPGISYYKNIYSENRYILSIQLGILIFGADRIESIY